MRKDDLTAMALVGSAVFLLIMGSAFTPTPILAADSQTLREMKELKPSMSYEEYQKRYDEYYGDATARMAEEGNPADFLLDDGKDLANKVEGSKGKSCASCHGKDALKLKGAATGYPEYKKKLWRYRDLSPPDQYLSRTGHGGQAIEIRVLRPVGFDHVYKISFQWDAH